MSLKNTVKAITLTAFNTASLNGTFKAINPNGLDAPCFWLRVNNDSDVAVFISYDGVNIHDYVDSADSLELQFQTNHGPMNQSAYMAKGTIVYVTEVTTAGTGNIFLSGYYQPQSN